jgi:protein SCO1/2
MATAKKRSIEVIIAFAGSLVAALLLTIWLMSGDKSGGNIARAVIGGPFQLVDQDNNVVTDKTLLGRPTLIFFGFTHCPDVCPTTLFEVSEVLRALGNDAGRVGAYFVSVDPERDTPAVMKNYLASFDPHLKALSGNAEATAKIMTGYRVYAKKVPLESGDYTMDHTALVYLMDSTGKFVAPFNVKRPPADAAEELRRYF